MTTRALEELDGSLGNCQGNEGFSALDDRYPGQPQENRTRVMPRLADSSGWPHDSQEPETKGSLTGGVDAKPKKTDKGPVAKVAPGSSKERLKAGASGIAGSRESSPHPTEAARLSSPAQGHTARAGLSQVQGAGLLLGATPSQALASAAPRSPVRKKAQVVPPPQPPPPPPALNEELPWGDLSLNKCLVLASLVALLGSAFQLCQDAIAGEVLVPVPEPWVPPSSDPKKPASPLPTPVVLAPSSGSPVPQVETGEKTEVPESMEVVKDKGESGEAAGKERGPLVHRGSKERPRKESPRKERRRKEERPLREETPRKAEKPRAAKEPRGALSRGWEAREEGHRLWVRDSGDPEHRKRQVWASPRHPYMEDRLPGRQKHRAGKGRD